MAIRAAAANGNLTAAGTWGLVDSTSYNNSEAANTALTTSYVESTAFTPGAITIDGIAFKIASRASSPTGTLNVRLAQAGVTVANTEIQVNVSDLPTATATSGSTTPVGTAEGGWFFVKFASPVTLLAATAYTLSLKTSSSSQVNAWSLATSNWSRYLRTTTTGAPAAGDDMIITGEWTAAGTVTSRTVTMDSTANTDYGSNTTTQVTPAFSICKNGTLSFGTSSSTTYILQSSGYMVVYNGGTLNVGSSGSEVPRGSTATLQFDCAADGDFGLVARLGATVNMAGLSRTSGKNVSQTKLNADAAVSATSLTLVDDTGWLSGDSICLAPTTRTSTQFEKKAASGNATATTIAVAALTNAHSGTSPTQAEVGLLTRNVIFTATNTSFNTFLYAGTTAVVSLSWVEFSNAGPNNLTSKAGWFIATTTGSFTASFCSGHDCRGGFWRVTGAASNNITLSDSVFYNTGTAASNFMGYVDTATTGTWSVLRCMFCGTTGTSSRLLNMSDVGGTVQNCSFSGNAGTSTDGGVVFIEANSPTIGTFTGNQSHSNAGFGVYFNSSGISGMVTFDSWRNNSSGTVVIAQASPYNLFLTFSSCNLFGNATLNVDLSRGNIVFDNCTMNGDTTFSTATNINGPVTAMVPPVFLRSCQLSVVSGIKTKANTDLSLPNNAPAMFIADNTIFNGTAVFGNTTTTGAGPFLMAQNFGQVANDNRTYISFNAPVAALIKTNTSTVYGASLRSEEMQPAVTTSKLQSSSILVAVNSGQAATVSVQVQKNAGYNGNAPRLILKRQDSMGVTADQVLATFSAGSGSWQTLSGTSSVAPQDGVFEFVVDCDGTAGSIFVDGETAIAA